MILKEIQLQNPITHFQFIIIFLKVFYHLLVLIQQMQNDGIQLVSNIERRNYEFVFSFTESIISDCLLVFLFIQHFNRTSLHWAKMKAAVFIIICANHLQAINQMKKKKQTTEQETKQKYKKMMKKKLQR